ncbi:AMP-dependent synthetase [Actinomadura spongiicola]|uniref:AMP-dependent synthetase n=1 Tax=Actinomadura spongiicola TaxID=2303421 RepID=A0A372GFZ2_9ACTN|nr:AMP-binding protein [Actinomadura spongiicola]RFS84315.1 AMP-dependent synthetase [Actinomadura spongiicola]
MESIINAIVAEPPEPGHRLRLVELHGTQTIGLPELHETAGRLAGRLREEGVRPGDRIGILAANCLEWVLLDLAALRLGVVTAGFEPGKFEGDGELLARYDLELLFTDRGEAAGVGGVRAIKEVGSLAEAPPHVAEPHVAGPPAVRYEPGDVTTLKFTSGSTGQPKGLAASVGSIDSSLRAVQEMFQHGPEDDLFVFLPLSLLQQRYWIYSALRYGHDVTVSTYEAAFMAMRQTRPTVVMGVPGFYETAKKHIEARADATGVTREEAARRLFGDRIRYLWTGSAPASAALLRFFGSVGLPIYEGYGLNETCIVSKNHPGAHREGSVGRVLPGKHVLLDEAGAISVRADFPVNTRYEYARPGESERMFGPDGTVRTGDVGHIDEDGFLYIHGRADDTLVLDNGKKIVVRPVEEAMKADPEIAECVIFCLGQSRLVAVVSPARTPADEAAIAARLAQTNAALERDERIWKVVIADPPFTIDGGTLTSQFKPKRNRIHDLYRPEIHDSDRGIHA